MSAAPDVSGWIRFPLNCCLCFAGLTRETCYQDPDGQRWDLCVPCAEREAYANMFVLMARS